MSAYLKSLADLKGIIITEGGKDVNVGAEKAKGAASQLDTLAGLFNASMFDTAATTLAAKLEDPTEVPKRRALKEEGLLHVRRFQRTLASHKLLQTARANPFKELDIRGVEAALSSFNGALQAS